MLLRLKLITNVLLSGQRKHLITLTKILIFIEQIEFSADSIHKKLKPLAL